METAPSVLDRINRRVTVENIYPTDPMLKLFPQLVPEHLARYNFVREYMKDKVSGHLTVLDAASGQGYGSAILSKQFPEATVLGVELGMKYVRKANERLRNENVPASFTPLFANANVLDLPLRDGSVDVVTAFEITEHLEKADQRKFIQEIVRVLKEGGTAFISTPLPYSGGLGANVYHRYEPSDQEVRDMIEKEGLTVAAEKGQIFVEPKTAQRMKALNRIVPIWPFFAWMRRGEEVAQVRDIPQDKLALTHMFVVTKPHSQQS